MCSSCEAETNESEVLKCIECQQFYHVACKDVTPYGCKTFIAQFKKVKVDNYLFFCNVCKTERENVEASDMRRQLADLTKTMKELSKEIFSLKSAQQQQPNELVETVKELAEEIKALKSSQGAPTTQQPNELIETVKELSEEIKALKSSQVAIQQPTNVTQIPPIPNPWKDQRRTENVKASLLIKSNGGQIDMKKINELATNNRIQVSMWTCHPKRAERNLSHS